ncbi:MAG: nucleotidyltransferase family protein [Saprospiraceae bacterium]|nr:nucleotidyltransferase family protein [Saprospiraceae bacterium]
MIAIILAGGLGTRLHSVTRDMIPKVMAEVKGKPFIHWQLHYLKNQGIHKIIMAVHHHADQVRAYVGDKFAGLEVLYSFESIPLGTGGAARLALNQADSGQVWIMNGDTWFPVNLQAMLSNHRQSGNDITLALKKLFDFDRYGSVTIGKNCRITAFKEKQPILEGYINGGIYLIETEVLKSFQSGTRFSLEHDLFEQKVGQLKIGGFKSRSRFIDMGIPTDFEQIQTLNLL